MTSRYRIEYALKSHKRDELIEWIKGLLAVPFVLHGDIDEYEKYMFCHGLPDELKVVSCEQKIEKTLQTRYLEVFHDVEKLIDNTIALDERLPDLDQPARTRLRQLVPSVGRFFTKLPLKEAFLIEDRKRLISRRTLVSPSFNDIRSILNTAQVLALAGAQENDAKLRLVTFDGDVTLYEDGKCLEKDSPLVALLVKLLSLDLYVAVVTAAGYPGQLGADMYQERLLGLIQALRDTNQLLLTQKNNFLVMGAESNYLFRFSSAHGNLRFIEGCEWYLPIMQSWNQDQILEIMDLSHDHLKHLRRKLRHEDENKTTIIRKERSLGIIPVNGYKIQREILEEMVLSILVELNDILSHNKSTANAEKKVQVCAFNGGSDVWVDIGDKALGVEALQLYLYKTCGGTHGKIAKSSSLHIGDQFASVGANDFKARLSACTVWIASPRETTEILEELTNLLENNSGKVNNINLLA
ncbi:IMP-specific 5'-nucleotidase 1 [Metschnikowia bicuspidata var. bicuspidata NRRL YB-4993]|uniref:IMP-specific 5'-nucleotidase 1 n=1 Tax=Metschnikowia bicuspidata var. bicuspidata NRRL YB-4993 TaxID=869754 RepID=A0A1A0H8K8_9ASCO|nr:IMP-specific 5'-nucleotidase 1 [Metschnikowia bicuspidata var. bicuspidata NRRL YB-4993]OBA20218.1 IMP-specific 5'-nucleotidase 1 [Metschnikowia bicuspidata var. bicuspidata NRRL YB-4993]